MQGMTLENLVASISGELVGLLSPSQALVISSGCLTLQIILDLCVPEKELAKTRSQI